ncbi:MAG: hypothetical protein ACO1N5_04500 [Noviherbaspirillum sp.]
MRQCSECGHEGLTNEGKCVHCGAPRLRASLARRAGVFMKWSMVVGLAAIFWAGLTSA